MIVVPLKATPNSDTCFSFPTTSNKVVEAVTCGGGSNSSADTQIQKAIVTRERSSDHSNNGNASKQRNASSRLDIWNKQNIPHGVSPKECR